MSNTTADEWTAEQIQAIWARTFTTTQFFHDMANAINAAPAAKDEEWKQKHCKDCCCARAWEALGDSVKGVGSIPEHIQQLRSQLAAAVEALTQASFAIPTTHAAFETVRAALAKIGVEK